MHARLLTALLALLLAAPGAMGAELLPGGGFETGNGLFLVLRSPAYGKGAAAAPPQLDTRAPLTGQASLLLPALPAGQYTLASTPCPLAPGAGYEARLTVGLDADAEVRIELRGTGDGRLRPLAERDFPLRAGVHRLALPAATPAPGQGAPPLGWLFVQIKTRGAVRLDEAGLSGPGPGAADPALHAETVAPLGVWRAGEAAQMRVYAAPGLVGPLGWSVTDHRGARRASGEVEMPQAGPAHPALLPLPTDTPGIFTCALSLGSASTTRRYAVIPQPAPGEADPRFGMSIEGNTGTTMLPAAATMAEHYRLLRDMGTGSVRNFSMLNPATLSRNGRDWDFSELDESMALARAMGWPVFLPLGSSYPDLLPGWLRTDVAQGNVDLQGELRTKKLKEREGRKGNARYLDEGAYRAYLRAVMAHLAPQGVDYEIWNEPGHKFSPQDTLRLARMAREARDDADPDARIIGFSSTKGPGRGQGADPRAVPAFFQQMLDLDGGKLLDVVSYHSGHAYMFLGDGQDVRDQETGYAPRLAEALRRAALPPGPIWDTERASPWYSATLAVAGGRLDLPQAQDIALDIASSLSGDALAALLPLAHAAAFADGVERVYWFSGHTATAQWNAVLDRRWWLWDVMLEPSALIPAYAGMTARLSAARLAGRRELGGGARAYLFVRDGETVVLAADWQGQPGVLTIDAPGPLAAFGTMGETLAAPQPGPLRLPLDGWPLYVVTPAPPQGLAITVTRSAQ